MSPAHKHTRRWLQFSLGTMILTRFSPRDQTNQRVAIPFEDSYGGDFRGPLRRSKANHPITVA